MADISFEGQVVVITGAGGGIGRTYALDIARRGGSVVVNDVGATLAGGGSDANVADAVVAEIVAAGGRAVASHDSVSSRAGATRIVETALDQFGRIDALINNAGNLRFIPFEECEQEDVDAILGAHLLGSYHVTQAAWPHLKRQGYGRVVFTTSGAGMMGTKGLSVYGMAKAGISGLMHVLSLEGEPHGILCNAVHPNAMSRMASVAGIPNHAEDHAVIERLGERLGGSMTPDFNTGLGVYLASTRCDTTHGIYSSLAGRYARVIVGVVPGWQASREVAPDAEDIAAHIEEIRAVEGEIMVPRSLTQEMSLLLQRETAEPGGG